MEATPATRAHTSTLITLNYLLSFIELVKLSMG